MMGSDQRRVILYAGSDRDEFPDFVSLLLSNRNALWMEVTQRCPPAVLI